MLESRFPGLSFSDRRLKLRSRESFCNEGLSFLALLWGFDLLLKIDRRDLKFGGRVASLFTENPRRGVFGNPYSAERIVMRLDWCKEPLHALVDVVGNTVCSTGR